MRKDLQFMTTSCRIKWFEISSFGGDLIFALFRCHSVVRKQPMCLTTHRETNRKFNDLFKMYDLRGTNVRKDLQFMTTSCRIKWFEISSFGGGPNICSISLSFCCTKATDVPYHTS